MEYDPSAMRIFAAGFIGFGLAMALGPCIMQRAGWNPKRMTAAMAVLMILSILPALVQMAIEEQNR